MSPHIYRRGKHVGVGVKRWAGTRRPAGPLASNRGNLQLRRVTAGCRITSRTRSQKRKCGIKRDQCKPRCTHLKFCFLHTPACTTRQHMRGNTPPTLLQALRCAWLLAHTMRSPACACCTHSISRNAPYRPSDSHAWSGSQKKYLLDRHLQRAGPHSTVSTTQPVHTQAQPSTLDKPAWRLCLETASRQVKNAAHRQSFNT